MDPAIESADPAASPFWMGGNRRSADRRGKPTRPWSGLLTPLRREGGRRTSDRVSYVDRYTKQDVILLVTIFLLNVADAFFTLLWLGRGGREANPVMDFLLDIGPWAFLAQKCLVVGLWLVILVVHKNFRMARIGLYSALVVYGILIVLHFGIIASGVQPPKVGARVNLDRWHPDEISARRSLPRTHALAIDGPTLPDHGGLLTAPGDRSTLE